MEIAKVHVSGILAGTVYCKPIPAGVVGATVRFEYADPIWDGLTKTVVFKGACTKDVLNAGEVVEIPPEVVAIKGARIVVGIYGTDAQNNLAIPTLWADLGVTLPAADPSGDTSTDPSLPVWAQLEAMIGDLTQLDTEARNNLVVAINEAMKHSGGSIDEATLREMVDDYLAANPPEAGAPGQDGGYYTPSVTQPDEGTVEFNFTPSREGMPEVEPVSVTLPVGANSGENGGQRGLTAAQISALDGMFRVCAFIKTGVSSEYNAFKTAFGIDGSGGSDVEPGTPQTGVSNETTWTNGVAYTYNLILGECLADDMNSGEIIQYSGWNRTPYLYCAGASKLRFEVLAATTMLNSDVNNKYCGFYDADKNFIQRFGCVGIDYNTVGAYVDVDIPVDAVYFIASHKGGSTESAVLTNNLKLTPYE